MVVCLLVELVVDVDAISEGLVSWVNDSWCQSSTSHIGDLLQYMIVIVEYLMDAVDVR